VNLWEAGPTRYGDKPFLTWYDDDRGERVELSYRSFDHWRTPVVLAACWRAGTSVVALDPQGPTDGLVTAFVREELLAGAASALEGTMVVALTADLLGRATHDLGRALNFSRVVPTMGDLFDGGPDPAGDALVTGEGAATMAELLERAAALATRTGLTDADRMLSGRRLLTVDGAAAGLLAPFVAGAGVVLGRDLEPGRFWKRVADERVAVAVLDPDQAGAVLAAGPDPAGLDRSRLRVVASPGASEAVAAGFQAAFGIPLLAD
jgi:uncharacterized protein (TIGR03089 family)